MAHSASIMPAVYSLPFIKMQATGNDLIFLDGEALLNSAARPLLSQWPAIVSALTKQLCSRKLSIGADGLILAMALDIPELAQLASNWYGETSKNCQLSWTYNNSDGSISNMCGNGLRCLALWAKQEKNMSGSLKVATAMGAVAINYESENNIIVTLGAPRLNAGEIPFLIDQRDSEQIVKKQFKLGHAQFPITCVNVGNPHCVIFEADFLKPEFFLSKSKVIADDFFPEQLRTIAAAIEIDDHFPERTNVEFVHVVDRQHIKVLVWERGSGPTLSCGSGAVASAIASILEKRTDRQVKVTLPGGTLFIDWSDENVIKMSGPANLSFRGQIEIPTKLLRAESNKKARVQIL